ncbi:glycosyltransferase [Maribacter sp. R77961]|uniref:glycosyltransferase n=1 Tax=Maribacter sp. R77961 TaxID=3093871 RepID=UPI0037C97DF8
MKTPLVSIVIPFKNTGSFLEACLNSIIAQTFINWEVLAVNDASSDRSLAIVQNYASKDRRIKVFHNNGQGIIEALRTAYTFSEGKFITRMDSDDLMMPERLKIMVTDLENKGKGHVAVGQVKYFSKKGISNGYQRYEKWLNALTLKGTNYSELYKECVIPSPCWMVHKSDLELCGAFEPNEYPEDYDLAFRFYEHGLKIIPSEHVLLKWRDYDHRTSRTSAHYAHNYFLDIKLRYFIKLHLNRDGNLVVWGAGNKGKRIATILIDRKIPFHWICNNPKKIGREIYGKILLPINSLENIPNTQSIITVANEEEQQHIHNYFDKCGKISMKDYFFFC